MPEPLRTMITFTQHDVRFTLRIAGVLVDNGRVLLHRAEGDEFWALPGGRGELQEPAVETLRREMREELDVDVEVVRLLWVVENFFLNSGWHHHELGMYFLMRAPADWLLRHTNGPFLGQEGQVTLVFQWFPLDRLETMRVYPSFLSTSLMSLPPAPQHVVHIDE